jgi:3-dehydroquinate dehydratase II
LNELLEPLKATYPCLNVTTFQSNHEGELIDTIQGAATRGFHGIVINPGAFTHTSVAIGDALRASTVPAIEVHLSHVYAREEFRRHNLVAAACIGSISGLRLKGYVLAIKVLLDLNLNQNQQ